MTCVCSQYSACGCDDNDNTTYIDGLLENTTTSNNGSGALATIANVNGTRTVIINGTLENGTDDGDDDGSTVPSIGNSYRQNILEHSGYWLMVAWVGLTVFAL